MTKDTIVLSKARRSYVAHKGNLLHSLLISINMNYELAEPLKLALTRKHIASTQL